MIYIFFHMGEVRGWTHQFKNDYEARSTKQALARARLNSLYLQHKFYRTLCWACLISCKCILASFRRWRLMPELLYKNSTVNRVLSRCLPRSASRPMAAVRYPRGSGGTKQDPRESGHSQVRHPLGWDRVSPHPNKAARSPLYPPSPALPPVPLFLLQGSAPAHLLVRCVMFLCREASVFSTCICI